MKYRFLLLLVAAALGSWLLGVGRAAEDGGTLLAAGEMAVADLDAGEAVYRFTAPSGSVYDVWLFPAGEDEPAVSAALWRGDRLVAEGEGGMPAMSLRLAAGVEYRLRLRGSGRVRLEVARHALSRCFALPMMLEAAGDAYSKAFARLGDAHWYALDAAESGLMTLLAAPAQSGLRLEAALFDADGRLLGSARQTGGGACLLDIEAEALRRYALRLTARDGGTGLYYLTLIPSTVPEGMTLSPDRLTLWGRESARLEALCLPEGGPLYWESADPEVAAVDEDGWVTGGSAGETAVTAYAPGGVSARCDVEVRHVPVTGVAMLSGSMSLSVGDDAAIECEVSPGNASDPRLAYAAEPEGVVEIDERGVLRGVAEGTATVTARSLDGGYADALTVRVNPAPRRWRALLVGEQNYADGVAAVRTGSVNSVVGVRSMLENLSFDGAKFQVATLLDASRDEVLAGISESLSEAGDGDFSLFYITCHGDYAWGMTCLRMYDGSVLAAPELAEALRSVKGDVLVVIDCCGSGGVIGRASAPRDILRGIDGVFSGQMGPAGMATSRFRVLASAALEQESYRVSFGRGDAETGMSTVFARALCAAGGWDIDRAARSALRADRNDDGAVTLGELYAYVDRQVMYYLREAARKNGVPEGSYVQSVQVWPEGDTAVVFRR